MNMDLVVRATRMPDAGETIAGKSFQLIPGGKGANQAVAAARMYPLSSHTRVSMVGRVGADAFGQTLRQTLDRQGINTQYVTMDEKAGTGVAVIMVDDDGENRILIVAGANGAVDHSDLQAADDLISRARVVLMQFEIPLQTVLLAKEMALKAGATIVLNPAPAYQPPPGLLQGVDLLIMNETESALLTGTGVHDRDSAAIASRRLFEAGVKTAIFTLGANGAIVSTTNELLHVPGHAVQAVDTTAAGDAFVGALASSLARNEPLPQAVRRANAAGALAVTRFGAQPSLPSAAEVDAFLDDNQPHGESTP